MSASALPAGSPHPPEPIRAQIMPFRGIRYNTRHPGVDQGLLVAPPGEGARHAVSNRQALPENQPFHALHLFPSGGGKSNPAELDPGERQHLQQTFQHWLDSAVMIQDETPSIYVHHHTFEGEEGQRVTRRGFFALLAIRRSGSMRVLPHENTLPGRLTRQIQILEAIGAQVLPIFLSYTDPGDELLLGLKARASTEALIGDFTDGLGHHHRLERICSPDLEGWLESRLSGQDVLIADGHHRFDSLQALWKSHGTLEAERLGLPQLDDGEAYLAVYMTPADAPGFRVGAIHRVLRQLALPYDTCLSALSALYNRTRLPLPSSQPVSVILEKLASCSGAAFGLLARGEAGWDLLEPRPDVDFPALRELPTVLRALEVSHFHHELQPILSGGLKGNVEYEKDPHRAFDEVQHGHHALAIFLKSPSARQIHAVAQAGLTMPPKATYFYPKVAAGLVAVPVPRAVE